MNEFEREYYWEVIKQSVNYTDKQTTSEIITDFEQLSKLSNNYLKDYCNAIIERKDDILLKKSIFMLQYLVRIKPNNLEFPKSLIFLIKKAFIRCTLNDDYRECLYIFNISSKIYDDYLEKYCDAIIDEKNEDILKNAIKVLNDIIKSYPKDADFYNALAYLYGENNDYNNAVIYFNQAIELNPENPEYYNNRANIRSNNEKYNEALKDYNIAISLNPKEAEYYYNRALVYIDLNKISEGIIDINKAISINPNEIDYIQEAIRLQPTKSDYFNFRANIYATSEKINEAITDYETAINLNPKNAEYYYNRAKAKALIIVNEEVVEDFLTAIELKPESYIYYCEAYEHLEDSDFFNIFIMETKKIIDKTNMKNEAKYYKDRAECFLKKMNRASEAIKDIEEAYELGYYENNEAEYYYEVAIINRDYLNMANAISPFKRAIKSNPKNYKYYIELADLYNENIELSQDNKEIINLYENAINLIDVNHNDYEPIARKIYKLFYKSKEFISALDYLLKINNTTLEENQNGMILSKLLDKKNVLLKFHKRIRRIFIKEEEYEDAVIDFIRNGERIAHEELFQKLENKKISKKEYTEKVNQIYESENNPIAKSNGLSWFEIFDTIEKYASLLPIKLVYEDLDYLEKLLNKAKYKWNHHQSHYDFYDDLLLFKLELSNNKDNKSNIINELDEYYEKLVKDKIRYGQKKMSDIDYKIGNFYHYYLNNLDKAIEYYKKYLSIRKTIDVIKREIINRSSYSQIYCEKDLSLTDEATKRINDAICEVGYKERLFDISECYRRNNQYNEAIYCFRYAILDINFIKKNDPQKSKFEIFGDEKFITRILDPEINEELDFPKFTETELAISVVNFLITKFNKFEDVDNKILSSIINKLSNNRTLILNIFNNIFKFIKGDSSKFTMLYYLLSNIENISSIELELQQIYNTKIQQTQALLSLVYQSTDENNNKDIIKFKDVLYKLFYFYSNYLIEKETKKNARIINEKENLEKIIQARIQERNKTLSSLSHSIKNLLRSVIDPLHNLKQTGKYNSSSVKNAIRGANLIREIVNAMNTSYKGSFNDFVFDAHNNSEGILLKEMVIESLKYSISNMFDGKYFNRFMMNYFPDDNEYFEIKKSWDENNFSVFENLLDFIKEHFFNVSVKFLNCENFKIGDTKGSAVKMLILIQEMIFNAVKYVSFIDKKDRNVEILFSTENHKISYKITNNFVPKNQVKTTGLGHTIIKNFAELLNTKPIISKENNKYIIDITFENIWEK